MASDRLTESQLAIMDFVLRSGVVSLAVDKGGRFGYVVGPDGMDKRRVSVKTFDSLVIRGSLVVSDEGKYTPTSVGLNEVRKTNGRGRVA